MAAIGKWLPPATSAPTDAEQYRTFQTKYRDDPRGFVRDCLTWSDGKGATAYQDEILSLVPAQRRVSVRGPHGLGKTALAAWLVLWFALTRDGLDWKVVTTASAWRQLIKYLWPEIHKWSRRLRWDVIGREGFDPRTEFLVLGLKLGTGEAFAVASDQPELIEGAHADHLLYVFDEAKAIPAPTFDAAEGAFSGGGASATQEALAVAISTPAEPQGRFYDIHARRPGYEDWHVRHVTLEEAIAAGRVSRDWAEQRAKQWGAGSAVYQNRVLGEFAASDAGEVVIPLAWVEAANERWRAWQEAGGQLAHQESLGVDVGRGGDRTVLAPRYGQIIPALQRFEKADTMEVVGWVAAALRRGGRAIVDAIGIGAGVYDRLREQGKAVEGFVASQRTDRLDRSGELAFANKRAAAWWSMREMLDPAYGEHVALPPDDDLTGELTAPHWRMLSGGKVVIEAKEEVKARLGRSTDNADAVIQAFWQEGADSYGEVVEAQPYSISAGPY